MKDAEQAGQGALPPRMEAFTTFRLGGPCRALWTCRSAAEVAGALSRLRGGRTPFLLVGEGSNLLVADAGVDRVVVRYAEAPLAPEVDGPLVTVDAGADLDDLAAWCVERGLDGLLFASGIPGTVGGAVVGNAGAFGEQVADRLEAVRLLGADGAARDAAHRDLGFSYRRSALRGGSDVVLRATFRLAPGADAGRLRVERERLLAWRRGRHPDWRVTPCAGSFFRNVESGSRAGRRQAAGWFLEQAGARSMRVGGAAVCERHANIIVKAEPACTAQDVYDLSLRMAGAVRRRFGFDLVREVEVIGAFRAA